MSLGLLESEIRNSGRQWISYMQWILGMLKLFYTDRAYLYKHRVLLHRDGKGSNPRRTLGMVSGGSYPEVSLKSPA